MCNDRLLDKINSEIYKMVQDDNVNNIKLVDISKDGGIQTGITHEYGCDSTEKANYFSFDVIPTTFATVDIFDNPQMLNHMFFKDCKVYKDILDEFYIFEDILQNDYLYKKDLGGDKTDSDLLNSYLANSFNTHTIKKTRV